VVHKNANTLTGEPINNLGTLLLIQFGGHCEGLDLSHINKYQKVLVS